MLTILTGEFPTGTYTSKPCATGPALLHVYECFVTRNIKVSIFVFMIFPQKLELIAGERYQLFKINRLNAIMIVAPTWQQMRFSSTVILWHECYIYCDKTSNHFRVIRFSLFNTLLPYVPNSIFELDLRRLYLSCTGIVLINLKLMLV